MKQCYHSCQNTSYKALCLVRAHSRSTRDITAREYLIRVERRIVETLETPEDCEMLEKH